MRIINKTLVVCCFYLLPFEVMAQNQRSFSSTLLVNVLPLIIFIAVFIIIMKFYGKKTTDINERIVKSNEDIAKQVKRIADHLENNS